MELLPSDVENCWKLLTMQVPVVRCAPASRFASAEFLFLGIQSMSSAHPSVPFSLNLNSILPVSTDCITSRSSGWTDASTTRVLSWERLDGTKRPADVRLAPKPRTSEPEVIARGMASCNFCMSWLYRGTDTKFVNACRHRSTDLKV